jgi:pimeloyl-ACP methyl ester carboxylesterase
MKQIMSRVLEENLRPYLPRITTPTLILWSEKDTITPLSDAKILNEEIQNSYLHIFKGESHALQITIPEQLSNRVAEFLI